MATVISGNQVKLKDGKVVSAKQGEWYDGQQFWGGSLSSAGQIHSSSDQIGAGQKVSNEVISQTNPSNVGFIDQQINADRLQSPTQIPLSSGVQGQVVSGLNAEIEAARKSLEQTLGTRKTEVDTKLKELREKEQLNLDKIGELTTPFREELENAERERLYINQNFEANQALVDELDQLLTEGNDLIRQQQEVTGLASVRNPRIQKAMDDVAARAGVIQAVMSARNGQIAQAQNLIDRSINAIAADRMDQISYYETILNLNNRDILSLDADSKNLAQDQLNLKKGDLQRAQATADYVKQLLLDPATAALMGEAGVRLNDSVEQINSKLQNAQYYQDVREQSNAISLQGGVPVLDPSGVPAKQLVTFTDSRGKEHYYKMPASGSGGGSALAESLISKELAGLFGVDVEDISDDSVVPDILSISNSVVSPNFTPTTIGAIHTDNLGRRWQFTSTGWILIG